MLQVQLIAMPKNHKEQYYFLYFTDDGVNKDLLVNHIHIILMLIGHFRCNQAILITAFPQLPY